MRAGARQIGQTLLLFALCMLLLVLMVAMTLSIGTKIKHKAELQTVADAAAYSNAIATARTFNSISLLNRTMLSEWVAMAGIQSLDAWGSLSGAYMSVLGNMAYTFQMPVPGRHCFEQSGLSPGHSEYSQACVNGWNRCGGGCPADCEGRTSDTRAAAYEFWHAHYSLFNGRNTAGDNINQHCLGDGQVCDHPRRRKTPGFGQLDQDVIEQEHSVRDAIHNLTQLEQNVYRQLERSLEHQDLTNQALRASLGLSESHTGTPRGFEVLDGERQPALEQVRNRVTSEESTHHDRALWEATLGSIGRKFPTWMDRPPPQVETFIAEIRNNLDDTHPGRFRFGRVAGKFRGCAFFSRSATNEAYALYTWPSGNDASSNYTRACREAAGPASAEEEFWGWDAATASATDLVFMRYNDPCTHRWRSHPSPRPGANWVVSVTLRSAKGTGSGAHSTRHHGSPDYNGTLVVGGCHGSHAYYDTANVKDHALGKPPGGPGVRNDLLAGSLAYIFPPSYPAAGAEGQPKIPVLLSRRYDNDQLHDPWDLTVRLRGSRSKLNLDAKKVHGERAIQGALANGIAYYHRRGYWQEPANLLNPFWHATLVPANIDLPDHVGKKLDDTDDSLRAAGFDDAAQIYRRFMKLHPPFQGVQ